MMELVICYFVFSLCVGLVSILGFVFEWSFCFSDWWEITLLLCPISWVVIGMSFVSYWFFKCRHQRPNGGVL